MTRTRVAIIGATGYGGAELLRHLLWHPAVHVTRIIAKDHVGERIADVVHSLYGMTELVVQDASPADVVADADVVMLGLPHRLSGPIACEYARLGARVIDLSGDMRLLDAGEYERYYGGAHPLPAELGTFVYGLPELRRAELATASRVCSPGCFATAITLALMPWARAGLVQGRVRVCAMTGSSGSGANPSATTHHPLRAGTLRAYKPLMHQHTPEIRQSLRACGASDFSLDFVPVSAPLVRGILATCFVSVPAEKSPAELHRVLDDAYADEPLVRVIHGRMPEVGSVAGSMYCDVGLAIGDEVRDGRRELVVHSAIDNLVKGGAGQAVQSLNVMIGVEETLGLQRPALWP